MLWTLKQDVSGWASFLESLERVFHDLSLDISYDHSTDEYITVRMHRGEQYWLPIDSAGTGVLQAMQVLSYVGVYRPKLLILDEPDSHLHPDNQRRLARLLADLTDSGDMQVLLSTHSRHLLDEFSKLDAVIHWISGGILQEQPYDRVSGLLDLGALDAGDRLRGGATALVVITEDKKTELLRTLLASSGLREENFQVWSYAGSSKTEAALLLGRFIMDAAPGTKVLVHRDRDYLSDGDVAAFVGALQREGMHAFVTVGTDVESHFLDIDYLESVTGLARDEVERLVEQATKNAREKSLEVMINERVAAANRARTRGDGGQPNVGRLSREAAAELDDMPARFRHGKATLGQLREALQARGGRQVKIGEDANPRLSVPTIASIFERIKRD
ncbi:ATP/GTP-binding protein [uncultured Pseudokineococcus sp.]|uniref:AAA family ATPase n=1 Tax=uncultured Pseudokineococcus sp. TaxID=1642928 RepID=UPI002638FA55|nr:AAA family ATPase [uncultured Pseudokineococcus sp.]